MIKRIIIGTIIGTSIFLGACGQAKEVPVQTEEAEFNDVSIEDGEIVTKPQKSLTVKPGETIDFKDIMSAMYGDDIEITDIMCSNGTVEDGMVTIEGDSVVNYTLTLNGKTTQESIKIERGE